MEFDEYDTLVSHYLVYSEDGKTVLGCSRLTPVTFGCMLKDHFPSLVDDPSIFARDKVWEGTRFCVDSSLSADRRRAILQAICVGYLEFALYHGVECIIGLMPTLILRSVFERNGVHLDRLGQPCAIGDHSKIQAAAIAITEEQYARACDKTGCASPLGLASSLNRPIKVA
jgi:acyl homoserine lactone synthase